eukprot:CAMPEP_0117686410 /NCGR_PEP_ID=MMETSP0804-20121206/22430_1 /TAXON_ID=1074897 /ORGANISM="Tetraselmis astigmatica, Strain CCMP880" /LENGTH=1642 /DNA_ID=CAMNT_0005498091 /DNA_START=310 /DNA_END=5238 /DNA_ORIENTATION=-
MAEQRRKEPEFGVTIGTAVRNPMSGNGRANGPEEACVPAPQASRSKTGGVGHRRMPSAHEPLSQGAAAPQKAQRPGTEGISNSGSGSRRPGGIKGGSVPLASLISKIPQQFDRNKICVVEKGVTDIDELPVRYINIKALYLSNNRIRHLGRIGQFSNLHSLSLANNDITDIRELDLVAAACPKLEALMLEGNPISSAPIYREHVLHRLPCLKTLDGQEVSDKERDQALQLVRQEQGLLDVMISNKCLLHKMEMVAKLQAIHQELRVLFGIMHARDARADGAGRCRPSAHRLLQMWDFEGQLGDEDRRAFCRAVQAEVKQVFASRQAAEGTRAKRWESSCYEAIAQQQSASARLLAVIEAQESNMAKKWPSSTSSQELSLVREEHGLRHGDIRGDREALISEFRESAFSLMDGIAALDGPASPGNRMQRHGMYSEAAAAACQPSCPQQAPPSQGSRTAGTAAQRNLPNFQPPVPYRGPLQEEAVEAGDSSMGSACVSRGQPWGAAAAAQGPPCSRAEQQGFSSSTFLGRPEPGHPEMDMEALLLQVSQLQADLSSHMRGELHLQAINMQLKQMLQAARERVWVPGNDPAEEAVDPSDLLALRKEMEDALEVQQRLEARSQKLVAEKKLIEDTAREAVAAAKQAEELAREAQMERDKLWEELIALRQAPRSPTSACVERDRPQSKAFLDASVQHSPETQEPPLRHDDTGKATHGTADRNSSFSVVLAERDAFHKQCEEQKSFLKWHEKRTMELQLELETRLAEEKLDQAVQALHDRALLRRAWQRFRDAAQALTAWSGLLKKSVAFASSKLLCKWFRRWRLARHRIQAMYAIQQRRSMSLKSHTFAAMLYAVALTKSEEVHHRAALRLFRTALSRRVLRAWRQHVALLLQSECASLSRAAAHLAIRTRLTAVQSWRSYIVDVANPKATRQAWATAHHENLIKRKALQGLALGRELMAEKRVKVHVADMHRLLKATEMWRSTAVEKRRQRSLLAQAAQHSARASMLKGVKGLQQAVAGRQAKELALMMAIRHRNAFSTRVMFGAWRTEARAYQHERHIAMLMEASSAARHRVSDSASLALRNLRNRCLAASALRAWFLWAQICLGRQYHVEKRQHLTRASQKRVVLIAWQAAVASEQAFKAMQELHSRCSIGEMEKHDMESYLEKTLLKMHEESEISGEMEMKFAAVTNELEAALAMSAEREASLKEENERLQCSLSSVSADLAAAKQKEEELESSFQSLQAAKATELQELRTQLLEQGKLLDACESALEDTMRRAEAEAEDKAAELREQDSLNRSIHNLVAEREKQSRELTDRIEELRMQLDQRDSRIQSLSDEVSSLRRAATDSVAARTSTSLEFHGSSLVSAAGPEDDQLEADFSAIHHEQLLGSQPGGYDSVSARVLQSTQNFRSVIAAAAHTQPLSSRELPGNVWNMLRLDAALNNSSTNNNNDRSCGGGSGPVVHSTQASEPVAASSAGVASLAEPPSPQWNKGPRASEGLLGVAWRHAAPSTLQLRPSSPPAAHAVVPLPGSVPVTLTLQPVHSPGRQGKENSQPSAGGPLQLSGCSDTEMASTAENLHTLHGCSSLSREEQSWQLSPSLVQEASHLQSQIRGLKDRIASRAVASPPLLSPERPALEGGSRCLPLGFF